MTECDIISVVNIGFSMSVCLDLCHVQGQRHSNDMDSSGVCFTSSTALIRWEPLCSTAHLINEAQPCAAADTPLTHKRPGQTECGRGLTQNHTQTLHPTHCALFAEPSASAHTLIHICKHTFFEESPLWIQSAHGLVGGMYLLALTSQVYPASASLQMQVCVFVCM